MKRNVEKPTSRLGDKVKILVARGTQLLNNSKTRLSNVCTQIIRTAKHLLSTSVTKVMQVLCKTTNFIHVEFDRMNGRTLGRHILIYVKGVEVTLPRTVAVITVCSLLVYTSGTQIQKAPTVMRKNVVAENFRGIESQQSPTSFAIQAEVTQGAKAIEIQKAEEAKRLKEAEELRRQQEEAARLAYEAQLAAEESKYNVSGTCSLSADNISFMDYRMIRVGSLQYNYLTSYMNVSSDGLLRTDDGFIAVALGSYYGPIGSKYRFTTSTGQTFKVMKIDEKSDNHTTGGCIDSTNSMIEFIIDTPNINGAVKMSGTFTSLAEFSGTIVQTEYYNE
ncbi:hypothetical protein EDD63_1609 [Breznakia blatticola]|uniref:Uncharacterized protein n=1 Tax=Breznakia blatticola TaxID=1754012 RepID=A0A4R7Z9G7_9FIRM|nr:hypothetical protein [Breznakia blatticola]TDW09487.1 hypothetical protein EDD63_1609 [Breznakia blatticola]